MAESRRRRCIAPGSVSEQDLIAWARGDASADVQAHVSRCTYCQAEASAYARADATLGALFFRRSCPPSLTVGEFALGVLAPEEMIAVAEHLLECPHCAEERRRFAAFLAEPDEPPQPAGGVTRILRRLFAQPAANLSPAMALRGDEDEGTKTYRVDGYELTLSVQRTAGRPDRVITGLVLADEPVAEGAPVRLHTGERLAQATALDDLGNFVIEGVVPGEYRLELGLADEVIVVDSLHVS